MEQFFCCNCQCRLTQPEIANDDPDAPLCHDCNAERQYDQAHKGPCQDEGD